MAADPTAALRQARRRARLASQGDEDATVLRSILAAVLELSRKVDNLAESVDNRDVTRPTVTSRSEGARARARVRGEAPAPYGGLGASTPGVTVSRVTDLGATVLAALQGHGSNSAGAIRDALGHQGLEVPLADVAATLVQLLGARRVIREPGDGVKPDTWRAVDGALEALERITAPRLQVEAGPALHVTCQDYQAHQGLHRWEEALGAFVCPACTDPAPTAPPTVGAGATH